MATAKAAPIATSKPRKDNTMKIYKILGRRGRITIPYELRKEMNIRFNDILSFEKEDDDTIVIHRGHLCNQCHPNQANAVDKPTDETTLLEFLNGLSLAEQRAALVHLSLNLTAVQNGSNHQ